MLQFIKEKKNCTGCHACYSACPLHCISMKIDEEGFWYPEASEKCIGCRKCEIVCPILNPVSSSALIEQSAYAVTAKDQEIWKRSSSGGAFSEICRVLDDHNTMFVGAVFDGMNVCHKAIIGFDNIGPLCKSKYVQSEIGDTFLKIKKHVKKEGHVVFCGTPCQVAGLRKFLGQENLSDVFLIDIVCHGVGSPKAFKACCDEIGKELDSSVISYEFRAKRDVFETRYISKIATSDGRVRFIVDDPYIKLFLSQDCLRPSCGENCIFRNEARQGDITIADFNGLEFVLPELIGTKRNFSSLIVNTTEGKSAFDCLIRSERMVVKEIKINDVKEYNPLFFRQTWFSKNRDSFFQSFVENEEKAIGPYCGSMHELKRTFKGRLFARLPISVRRLLLTYKRKQNAEK